jgi:hypothetical protein
MHFICRVELLRGDDVRRRAALILPMVWAAKEYGPYKLLLDRTRRAICIF